MVQSPILVDRVAENTAPVDNTLMTHTPRPLAG